MTDRMKNTTRARMQNGCACRGMSGTRESACVRGRESDRDGRGREALLHRIQSLGFAMTETVLYLDVYPTNCMALRYYQRVRDELTRATMEYESLYGPLTAAGDKAENGKWQWTTQPWPWQMED